MSKYPFVPLGELGEIVAGSTPDTTNKEYWGGDIAWITPADLTNHEGIFFTGELRKITEAGYKSCSTRILPAGSILFSTRAPIGHCAVTSFPLCTNQGFKSIIPNERLDPVYGFFALKFFTPQIQALGRGATFTEVNKETFENFEIPLPPLAEQKRIASLLARADRLRQLRRAANALADSLLQSVFLEMFGDVVANEKGFDVFPFEEVSTRVTKGESPNWQGFSYEENGILFITSENVLWGSLDIASPKYISNKFHNKLRRSQLSPNDLLINLVGASIGRAALVTESVLPANVNQAVAVVSIDTTKLNPYFALYQILTPQKQKQLMGNIVESARANISLTNISELNLIVPPLALQEEFARIVGAERRSARTGVESLRARMAEAERQAQNLFESLLAQSFGG